MQRAPHVEGVPRDGHLSRLERQRHSDVLGGSEIDLLIRALRQAQLGEDERPALLERLNVAGRSVVRGRPETVRGLVLVAVVDGGELGEIAHSRTAEVVVTDADQQRELPGILRAAEENCVDQGGILLGWGRGILAARPARYRQGLAGDALVASVAGECLDREREAASGCEPCAEYTDGDTGAHQPPPPGHATSASARGSGNELAFRVPGRIPAEPGDRGG